MTKEGYILKGLDVIDIASIASRKNKKFLAIGLQRLEEDLGKDSKEFQRARKIYLDTFNEYTRSLMRTFFDDIEGL
jgi:hypothetical protein